MNFKVNGKTVTVSEEDEKTLLWFLREKLKLTGTRFGCGKGICGSCTVHVDGAPTRSCVLPIASVANKEVTTIEGLNSHLGKKLQAAWTKEQVPQCGYCQSGQIMQAFSLLKNNSGKQISRTEIVAHMDNNLCRCGTYFRIVKAIESVAKQV